MSTPMTAAPTASTTGTKVRSFRAAEGCQAHLVIDRSTQKAMVIDPRLDQVDEILDTTAAEGVHIRYVLDTHTHADHLSGVRLLSARSGAGILAHPRAKIDSERTLGDGDVFALGETRVQVLHSPGHTPDSLSLLVDGHLFTGDALFAGGAGRTDFMGGSAGALYDSFRRFEALPDETVVHPGHDYVGRPETTIAAERSGNPLMRESDRERLVERLARKGPLPRNMKPILAFNTAGPSTRSIGPLELEAMRKLSRAVRIVDVRSPGEFSNLYIEGSLNIPLADLSRRLDEIPRTDGDVVLVCRSGMRSEEAARILQQRGRTGRQLEGGISAWSQLGLPTDGRGRMPLEQQVRLVAGATVLVGSVLTLTLSPWFLIVPAFIGGGLTFSGVTGSCGMAAALARMPWNRHGEDDTAGGACSPQTTAACASTPDGSDGA
jgi:glyoxylase-like metal-dependent hydrolase (beta-lactamase superfamily II)